MRLANKVAIVSGAASGMGAATARRFAKEGAKVVIADMLEGEGKIVAGEIENAGGTAVYMALNVTDEANWAKVVADTVALYGRLDILVNNAGIAPDNLAENVREQDFDLTLQINLKGTFFASQAAGRVMIAQKSGRIINMSSQAGFAALPTESVYCMTKAGIAHLTKCLAVEWGKYNITVNAVAPTFIFTPGTAEALADAAFRADVVERIAALHRIGDPMDVAGAVVFLASPAASLITGHTLLIDGGWTAR